METQTVSRRVALAEGLCGRLQLRFLKPICALALSATVLFFSSSASAEVDRGWGTSSGYFQTNDAAGCRAAGALYAPHNACVFPTAKEACIAVAESYQLRGEPYIFTRVINGYTCEVSINGNIETRRWIFGPVIDCSRLGLSAQDWWCKRR